MNSIRHINLNSTVLCGSSGTFCYTVEIFSHNTLPNVSSTFWWRINEKIFFRCFYFFLARNLAVFSLHGRSQIKLEIYESSGFQMLRCPLDCTTTFLLRLFHKQLSQTATLNCRKILENLIHARLIFKLMIF